MKMMKQNLTHWTAGITIFFAVMTGILILIGVWAETERVIKMTVTTFVLFILFGFIHALIKGISNTDEDKRS